jgi:hypothetical protein
MVTCAARDRACSMHSQELPPHIGSCYTPLDLLNNCIGPKPARQKLNRSGQTLHKPPPKITADHHQADRP